MERRLTNAYDHMTMPEDCARRIEGKLQLVSQEKRKGRYTRIVAPEAPAKHRWLPTAAAALGLVLVLFAGGSLISRQAAPADPVVTTPEETIRTPADHYSEVTDIPAEEVEAFARIIQYNMLQRNWEPLHSRVQFPVTIQDEEVTDWDTFDEWMDAFSRYYVYTDRMEHETCRAMFCNWQGISMGNGLFWINEVGGELKITAIDVEIQEKTEETVQKKQVPEAFVSLLSGDRIKMAGVLKALPIEEYCADHLEDVKPDAFAVVDMDADDVCEIVISTRTAAGEAGGYLVLRQEENEIRAYSFRPGEMMELKKDGTFFRRDRDHRLVFNNEENWNWWYTEEVEDLGEKPLAQWHAWPCQRPDLLLRSYEYVTGTGWSSFPGIPYSYFESLVMERAVNGLDYLQSWVFQNVCIEEDAFYAFDADAPGTVVFGTLTEENGSPQFSDIGFYISNEYGELQGEVRNIHTEEPDYLVDTHLSSSGNPVQTPEEFLAYFGYSILPDEKTMQDRNAIKALLEGFAEVCLSEDPKALKPYLTEDAKGRIEGFPKGEMLTVATYGYLPEQSVAEGQVYGINPEFRASDSGEIYWATLELVKQKTGWKIQSYQMTR